jgi:hypothetical protein
MTYDEIVILLRKIGCDPGVYARGKLYRFHINKCGNFWADAPTELDACIEAVRNWIAQDCPLDGTAAQ